MKLSEQLMRGDWLYYRGRFNAFPFRVEQITKKKAGYHAKPGESRMHYIKLAEVQPIPLTDEILQRNGWEYNGEDEKFFPETWVGGGLMLQKTDDGYMIVVTSDYDDEDTNHTPFVLKYLHELQHALKLRGIDREITPY